MQQRYNDIKSFTNQGLGQEGSTTMQLKRIKHSMLDDGNPVLELRQSPMCADKPST